MNWECPITCNSQYTTITILETGLYQPSSSTVSGITGNRMDPIYIYIYTHDSLRLELVVILGCVNPSLAPFLRTSLTGDGPTLEAGLARPCQQILSGRYHES